MPRRTPKRKFRVTAWHGERVEDLGIIEATTAWRARDAARAKNAAKLGIERYGRGGGWTGKWRFRTVLADQEGVTKVNAPANTLLTDKVKRGLQHIYGLAWAEVDIKPSDFSETEREEMEHGFRYLESLCFKSTR